MPGRDRTGPEGMGPGSGRGMGDCGGASGSGGGRGRGRGRGRRRGGRGFGRGGGRGDGRSWSLSEARQPASQSELARLRGEADSLNRELMAVKKRIAALEPEQEGE